MNCVESRALVLTLLVVKLLHDKLCPDRDPSSYVCLWLYLANEQILGDVIPNSSYWSSMVHAQSHRVLLQKSREPQRLLPQCLPGPLHNRLGIVETRALEV